MSGASSGKVWQREREREPGHDRLSFPWWREVASWVTLANHDLLLLLLLGCRISFRSASVDTIASWEFNWKGLVVWTFDWTRVDVEMRGCDAFEDIFGKYFLEIFCLYIFGLMSILLKGLNRFKLERKNRFYFRQDFEFFLMILSLQLFMTEKFDILYSQSKWIDCILMTSFIYVVQDNLSWNLFPMK